ncbi:hypothetical protein AMELA_G00109290, partial [Ameiurus melas]
SDWSVYSARDGVLTDFFFPNDSERSPKNQKQQTKTTLTQTSHKVHLIKMSSSTVLWMFDGSSFRKVC